MTKILITGAGSGLGRALALDYAARGAEICVADVNLPAAQAVCEEIEQGGGSAFAMACDITSDEQVESVGTEIQDGQGHSIFRIYSGAISRSPGNCSFFRTSGCRS